MQSITKRQLVLFILVGLLGVGVALGVAVRRTASISLADLAVHREQYNHRRVSVYGAVSAIRRKVSQREHPYYTFVLEDDSGANSVTVFTFGVPPVTDGGHATAIGRYDREKRVGPWTIRHEVDVTYGKVVPGHTLSDRLCGRGR